MTDDERRQWTQDLHSDDYEQPSFGWPSPPEVGNDDDGEDGAALGGDRDGNLASGDNAVIPMLDRGSRDDAGDLGDEGPVDDSHADLLGESAHDGVDTDLDGPVPDDVGEPDRHAGGARRPSRFDSKVAMGFAGALAVAVVVVLGAAVTLYGGSAESSEAQRDSASAIVPVAAAPSSAAPASPAAAANGDRPLRYTADAAGSCPAGSTAAQTMDGADPRNAFVCVRKGVGDGQVIEIELQKSYVVTAVCLTPGWIGQDSSGVMRWSQHRVVKVVQYMFNDTERTVLEHDTKSVHGEACKPVKPGVVASSLQILIRETGRPPADVPTTPPSPQPGLLDGLDIPTPTAPLAPFDAGLFGGGQQSDSDPVDSTFAISSLKIIGFDPLAGGR